MRLRSALSLVLVALAVVAVAPTASAAPLTYRVQVDAPAPPGEPWAFLRFFPGTIKVHRGDVVNFAWAGDEAPHTATVVPADDAEAWRNANQGPGDPYADPIVDTAVGGDDGDIIENPAVAFPSDPFCGTDIAPCSFDGSGVVNSGLQFSDPSAEPSYHVSMDAPIGHYSFLCLLHPGMQIPVTVVRPGADIRSPSKVDEVAAAQVATATAVDAEAADAQAQDVSTSPLPNGGTKYTLNAGGFSNQVTANEFPDDPLSVDVGDRIRFNGTGEIHTVTFPSSSIATVPFISTVCEVSGPDTPASSPFDCASPADFQLVLNPQALFPTTSRKLRDTTEFVNSGLLVTGVSSTFVARQTGAYTFICLVHGPAMSSTITVA